jgi:hypothetical protein
MTKSWDSLYLTSNDSRLVAETLSAALTALGYEHYNPFGLLPGKAYPHHVRLFVAPAVDGWTRVIGAPDIQLLPMLSASALCLFLSLNGAEASVKVFENGAETRPESTLAHYLRPGHSADELHKILKTPSLSPSPSQRGGSEVRTNLPLDSLPADMQTLAGGVDMNQAQKMFDRLSGNLLGKVAGKEQAEAARALLSGGEQPQWNSGGGILIRSLMNILTIPDNWREPDFESLRDAYALHERKRRNPNAHEYPGDAETMNKVPEALAYIPVYAGRKDA